MGGLVGFFEDGLGGEVGEVFAELSDEEFVFECADAGEGVLESGDGVSPGVVHAFEVSAVALDLRAMVEGVEVEFLVVELLLGFGVAGLEDLESAVEEEALDLVGADASADVVRRFENEGFDAQFMKAFCGGQTCEAGADDDDWCLAGQRLVSCAGRSEMIGDFEVVDRGKEGVCGLPLVEG